MQKETKLSSEQRSLLDVFYEFRHTRFVAHFDLLGFKKIIENHSLKSLVENIQPIIAQAIQTAHKAAQQIWTDKKQQPVIEKPLWFSDTIILFTKEDSGWSLLSLVMVSISLFCELLTKGFPVRGSITHGPFYYEPNKELGFLGGLALIQAYQLEKEQDWCGAILDHKILKICKDKPDLQDVIKLLRDKNHLVEYLTPMQYKDSLLRKFLCINWPQEYIKSKSNAPFPVVDNMISRGKGMGKWPEFRKIKNTQDFFEAMTKQKKSILIN